MSVSKVILNGTTLMDVTQDTVASSNLLTGYTAHGADGDAVTGEYAVPSGTINILQNGVVDVTSYASANVNVSGGGAVEEKDVNFYDYDGTLVDSYTKTEFAALSAMPSNPSHTGLTAQGWNWSLSDAKTYVNSYDKLDIGQMYVTDDGKTRIYIHLDEGRLEPYLGFCINGTAVVDWGDGSSTTTVTGSSTSTLINTQHIYAISGDYMISISVNGTMVFTGSSSYGSQVLWKNVNNTYSNVCYQSCIRKVEIGSHVNFNSYAFAKCYLLSSIIISTEITSISYQCFYYCESLLAIIIPNTVTSFGNYTFWYCYALKLISIPNSISDISTSMFSSCSSLQHINIPNSVTSISNSAFDSCLTLQSITIPSSVLSVGQRAFSNCGILLSVLNYPNIGTIGSYMFSACLSLRSVTIPNSITTIDTYAFQACQSLSSITIPSSVTNIKASAFSNCYGLGKIVFNSSVPPTVASSNAWNNLPTDCKIYVPSGSLSSYTGASNYPSSSTYTYIEY